MARKYASKAGEDLRIFYRDNFSAQVDIVNAAEGIVLVAPTDGEDTFYLPGIHPFGERYPRMEFEHLDGFPTDGGSGLRLDSQTFRFAAHLIHAVTDGDHVAGQEQLRQYGTAMMDTLFSDITLGSQVVMTLWESIAFSGATSEKGEMIGVASLICGVHLHSP